MTEIEPARLTRRSLLSGVLASALAGSACSSSDGSPVAKPPTVASLTAGSPFYIAHRGGGGDWPEMTAYAYEQAARIPGLQALEISVCLSADNVLVCSHDATTTRVTGARRTIAEETWATLSTLQVSPADTTDRTQPARPLARLDDLLERYIDRYVLFIEPKVPAAEAPLLNRLQGLLNPDRVVWKQTLTGAGFGAAKNVGFGTWGYVLDEPSHLGDNLTRLAADPKIDMLGIPVRGRAALVQAAAGAAAANGKKTIAWPIITEADRQRALVFGASGLMTSRISELMPPPTPSPGTR